MSNENDDKRRTEIDEIIDLLQPVRVYPITDPAVILANDTEFTNDSDEAGPFFNVDDYCHDGIMTFGLNWEEQSEWKNDNDLTDAQKDEVFDWLQERTIDMDITFRLRHPEA